MRILSVGNFGYGWDGSMCDEEHIAQALEALGHEVYRKQREDPFWDDIPGNIDFVLLAQWDGYSDDVVHELRVDWFHCPVVYWAFDYQANGQEWHERLVAEADLYLSKRIADSKYPNWRWLSQDFAPAFLDKWDEPIDDKNYDAEGAKIYPRKDIDVLFTGSYLPWATERNETLSAVNQKFNLVIHSVNSWPEEFKDVRPPIMDTGLPELYARAKVILSIDHTIEAGYWSDRTAQIMCCGRMPLFRYVPLSEVRFGPYVHYFYSIDNCLEAIDVLLRDQGSFLDDFAYEYAQEHLKVDRRVMDLLDIVRSIL